MPETRSAIADAASDAATRAVIWLALRLPYPARVRTVGWLTSRVIAPLIGWRGRVRGNLAYVWPDLPSPEVERIARAVPDHLGRLVIETYSGPEFVARVADLPVTGPGAEAFARARAEGRAVIAATAHFGSFNAVRAALHGQGHDLSGLYRPMANPRVNRHYVEAITAFGGEGLPSRGRAGLAGMMRHLKRGGVFMLLHDVHVFGGPKIRFFGKPARTALTTAELALRFDALLLPIYGLRLPDGLSFEIVANAPIPHGEPRAMVQALTDDLERMVRAHPGQWLWIHRRWRRGKKPAVADALG